MARMLSTVALGCLLHASAAALRDDADPNAAFNDGYYSAEMVERRLAFSTASLPNEDPVPTETETEKAPPVPEPGRFGTTKDVELAAADGKKRMKRTEPGSNTDDEMKKKVRKDKKMKKQKKREKHHEQQKRAKGGKSSDMTKSPSTSATHAPTVHGTKSSKKRRPKSAKAGGTHAPSTSETHAPTVHATKSGKAATPSPTLAPTVPAGITPSPTPSPVEDTIAPTSIPAGAAYYTSFELGSLDAYGEWNSFGSEGEWFLSNAMPQSGVFSAKAPNLGTPERTQHVSTLDLFTDSDWGSGALRFSMVPGVQMPIDRVVVSVDGNERIIETDNEDEYRDYVLFLSPGGHLISFFYLYNPSNLDVLPPDGIFNRTGVYIDDVYFVPDGTTPPPTPATAPTTLPPTNCVEMDPNPYDFEDEEFPMAPWSTGGAGVWAKSTASATSGIYSLASPDLDEVGSTIVLANATLELCDDFTGGQISMQLLTTVFPPHDIFRVYLDHHTMVGEYADVEEWTLVAIPVTEPGPHRIDFVYAANPYSIPADQMPPGEMGKAWIDDVTIQMNPS